MSGFTLVELAIGLVLMAILFAFAIPSFRDWNQNAQIRTMTSSLVDGLQLAKNEAVHRNAPVTLYLTTNLQSTCQLSLTGTNWLVSLNNPPNYPATAANSPAGNCNSLPSTPPAAPIYVIHKSSPEGTSNTQVTSSVMFVTFNGLGRASSANIVNNEAASIQVNNPISGTCIAAGGTMRCLEIHVTTGGRIRMCDPNLAAYPADPQGC